MSAQAKDTILINGKKYAFYGSPLFDYWEKNNNKPSLISFNTGLQRGFFAGWEIFGNKLYLISFYGEHYVIQPGNGFTKQTNFSLKDLFPNQEKVFADWFTGELKIPIGKQIDYSYSFTGAVHESNTSILIESGIVTDSGMFFFDN